MTTPIVGTTYYALTQEDFQTGGPAGWDVMSELASSVEYLHQLLNGTNTTDTVTVQTLAVAGNGTIAGDLTVTGALTAGTFTAPMTVLEVMAL